MDASGEVYDGTQLLTNGESAGGMSTTLTCCKAKDYADDDVIALDYGSICNAAASASAPLSMIFFSVVSVSSIWLLFSL
jgi:hypothetical protein